MQPCSREMGGMAPMASCVNGGGAPQIGLQELQNGHHQQQQQIQGGDHFDHQAGAHDDFFDQMLSSLPSWTELGGAATRSPWEIGNGADGAGGQKLFGVKPAEDSAAEGLHYAAAPYDESSLLASRLRQNQISGGGGPPQAGKSMVLQLNHQQMLLPSMGRSTVTAALGGGGCSGGGESGLLPLPLSLGSGGSPPGDDVDAAFKPPNSTGAEGLYNGFGGSLQRAAAQAANQPHFHHPQSASIPPQSFGGAPPTAAASQAQAAGPMGGAAAAPPRQKVRARRGQATDPHSIAERLRRERIADRMKALQELVPNANKTDKASMLDEIIDYVKFLQLQVKVLSMSRLGGAAAVAPLVADISSEGQAGGALGRGASGGGAGASDSMTVTEHQVAKLMEEDMGSAMQYLQGKGLCLMPISLASAISSATCHPRSNASTAGPSSNTHLNPGFIPPNAGGGDNPSSPSMSVLTVQSAMANGGAADSSCSAKDAASVSKP